jgi:hypothetical protein
MLHQVQALAEGQLVVDMELSRMFGFRIFIY